MSSSVSTGARKSYNSNLFKELGLDSSTDGGEEASASESDASQLLDEQLANLDEADLVELLNECSLGAGVEWQECGVLHTIAGIEIHETRTFAYDDEILGGKVQSMCRLKVSS